MESQLNPNSEPEQAMQNVENTISTEQVNQETEVSQEESPAQEILSEETAPVQEHTPATEDNEVSNEDAEEEIPETIFDNCSKLEITQALEELLFEQHVSKIKKQVSLLRSRFLQILKEDKDQALQSFLADGTSEVGTRIDIPVSLPFNSGKTLPTALAAPVEEGMMFSKIPRPPLQSF